MSRTHWKLWYSHLWFFTAKDTDLHQPREEVHAAESRKVPSVKLPVLSPWTIDWTSSSQSWCMTIRTEYCQCSQESSPEFGCPEFLLGLSNAGIRGFIAIYFFFFFFFLQILGLWQLRVEHTTFPTAFVNQVSLWYILLIHTIYQTLYPQKD